MGISLEMFGLQLCFWYFIYHGYYLTDNINIASLCYITNLARYKAYPYDISHCKKTYPMDEIEPEFCFSSPISFKGEDIYFLSKEDDDDR